MRVRWHSISGPEPTTDAKGHTILNCSGRVIQFLPDKNSSTGAKAVVLSDHSTGWGPGKRFVVIDVHMLAVDPPDKL